MKSLLALAAVTAFVAAGLAVPVSAAPVAQRPAVSADHSALTQVKSSHKSHKKSGHKGSHKSGHKKSKKTA